MVGTLGLTSELRLAERIHTLEAREAVHRTLCRYLELCDVPTVEFDWNDMAGLFTPDAVWEGIGAAYTGKFGSHEGRDAIVEMLREYLPPGPHFRRNAHLLTGGLIEIEDGTARGRWIMQQLSAYDSGEAELIAARLTVRFDITGTAPRIRRFQTEKLFTAPLDASAIGSLLTA